MPGENSPIESLEGVRVGGGAPDDADQCDKCCAPVAPGNRVAVFFTNSPFKEEFETPYPFRLHCLECEHESLQLSPEEYGELLVTAQLTKDKTIVDVTPKDYSGKDDGPAYDPVATLGELFDFPEEYIIEEVLDHQQLVSPQDFVHTLLENGMDPTKAVDAETGEITVTSEERLMFFENVFMNFNERLTSHDGALFDEEY